MTTTSADTPKPGYNATVVRNPNRDMLCAITTLDGVERAKWYHCGKHVFTVTTFPGCAPKYEAAI